MFCAKSVVAIELLNVVLVESFNVATDALYVVYPVVEDKVTCEEPLITPSVFNFDLIVVLIDEVNVFNDEVEVYIALMFVLLDAVYEFIPLL